MSTIPTSHHAVRRQFVDFIAAHSGLSSDAIAPACQHIESLADGVEERGLQSAFARMADEGQRLAEFQRRTAAGEDEQAVAAALNDRPCEVPSDPDAQERVERFTRVLLEPFRDHMMEIPMVAYKVDVGQDGIFSVQWNRMTDPEANYCGRGCLDETGVLHEPRSVLYVDTTPAQDGIVAFYHDLSPKPRQAFLDVVAEAQRQLPQARMEDTLVHESEANHPIKQQLPNAMRTLVEANVAQDAAARNPQSAKLRSAASDAEQRRAALIEAMPGFESSARALFFGAGWGTAPSAVQDVGDGMYALEMRERTSQPENALGNVVGTLFVDIRPGLAGLMTRFHSTRD